MGLATINGAYNQNLNTNSNVLFNNVNIGVPNHSGGISGIMFYNDGSALFDTNNIAFGDAATGMGTGSIYASGSVRFPNLPTNPIGLNSGSFFVTDIATAISNNYNVVCIA
jgi:hypothetical protein